MSFFLASKTYQRLNRMIDDAITEKFEELDYDETELSKLEVKWKRFLTASKYSKEKIEDERKNIQELVSDISHQTKTPLSNILLYTELLEEQPLNGEGLELVKQIKTQSEKLEFLIQALVKTSRLESGSIKLYPKEQSVYPMLRSIAERVKAKAEAKDISVLLKQDEKEQKLCAVFDRKWTEEAIYNLLDNAVKYSKEQTTITVQCTVYEMFFKIEVEDEGIGVKTEEIPHLFERFYRGSEVRAEEGVGIGLFLTREILNNQKGYIKVKQKEQGSIFQVFLPLS